MRRALILTVILFATLGLISLAYTQDNPDEALSNPTINTPSDPCQVGSQEEPNVVSKNSGVKTGPDLCGRFGGYIQGVCCCNPKTGELECTSNPLCQKAQRQNR